MGGAGEEVDRLDSFGDVPALLGKPRAVSGECRGVAGDVDDLFRVEVRDGLNERFAETLARRVDENDVRFDAVGFQPGGRVGGVPAQERGVVDAVRRGVALRVLDGFGDDLHAVEAAAAAGHREADGAGPAVEVEEDGLLGRGFVGVVRRAERLLRRDGVQHFRLRRVHLVEGFR